MYLQSIIHVTVEWHLLIINLLSIPQFDFQQDHFSLDPI